MDLKCMASLFFDPTLHFSSPYVEDMQMIYIATTLIYREYPQYFQCNWQLQIVAFLVGYPIITSYITSINHFM